MENLVKKITKATVSGINRMKTIVYYHVIRHTDENLSRITLRECYEAAISPLKNRDSIIQRVLEEGYASRYGRN